MKNYSILIFLCCTVLANAQLQTPQLSPSAILQQDVGLTEIKVAYSRPSVKERIIFGPGGLLPENEYWRLGANAATKFTFNDSITIGGKKLKKGTYTMLVKLTATHWDFSVYPYDSTDWNTYVDQSPLITFNSEIKKTKELRETFQITVQNITTETAVLEFSWEYVRVAIPASVETTQTVMTAIATTMQGPSLNDYFQAALFMHENNQDLPQALSYIQKVTKTDKALFFVVYREALILRDLQRNKEALASAKRALQLSKEAKNADFVRFNEDLIKSLE